MIECRHCGNVDEETVEGNNSKLLAFLPHVIVQGSLSDD